VRSQNHLTYEDLLQIVELIKSSPQFSEFHLKIGDIELDLRRRGEPRPAPAAEGGTPQAVQRISHVGGREPLVDAGAPARASAATAAPAVSGQAWPEGSIVLRSPMVGTFYRAPEPGAPPFAEVGQEVALGTTVCIIEVMKLMNSIPAGVSGVVTHVLVEDAAAVEYGQPLIVLRPK